MDDRETQALLDEVDAVRNELDAFQRPVSPVSRSELRAGMLLPLILGLGCGVMACYTTRVAIENHSQGVHSNVMPATTRSIPVAITRLEPGMVVRETDLAMAPINATQLRATHLLKQRVIVGRTVTSMIEPGVPILADQLARPALQPTLPSVTLPVAVRQLEPGTVVQENDLELATFSGLDLHPEHVCSESMIVGRTLLAPVKPGIPIYSNVFGETGGGPARGTEE